VTTLDTRFRRGWRPVLAAAVISAAVGCAGDTTTDPKSPTTSPEAGTSAPSESGTPTPSFSSSPTPDADAGVLPEVPPTSSASEFAEALTRALDTLRAPDSSAERRQDAAELHQLSARALATAPDRFRRKVLALLEDRDEAIVGSESDAAALLRGMTDPQKHFPEWDIVPAPPAAELLGYYREAERRIGVPWNYLAAIHLVETRMGRIRGTSTAGAQGPMQFLPATWAQYGAGGDIEDPHDAVLGAARLLRANGAPGNMAQALGHYNHSDSYVRAVTRYAETMGRSRWVYRSYWHWRVLYRHVRGTYVLPEGYPGVRPVRLPGE
jgi:soluble lytic murein transglycosylase-like protein